MEKEELERIREKVRVEDKKHIPELEEIQKEHEALQEKEKAFGRAFKQ